MNLDQEQLMKIANVSQRKRLVDWLKRNHISFKYTAGDKKVWTTQHQIEKSFETKTEVIRIGPE